MSISRIVAITLTAGAAVGSFGAAAQAEFAYGLSDTGSLLSFDTSSPSGFSTVGTISGLNAGHTLRGIDFRPNGGNLYGISTDSTGGTAQVYTINLGTGAATAVGGTFSLTGNSSARVSLDFNPAADRLRIVTGGGQSYRWNPVTGAFVQRDSDVAYAAGDANSGSVPFPGAVAYSNNFAGALNTTLYMYDYLIDNFATIGSVNGSPISPNLGTSFSVGGSGFVANTASMGFDISSGSGIAYLNADLTSNGIDNLYRVNLGTGSASLVGSFGGQILDISVTVPAPATAGLLGMGGLVAMRRRRA